MKRTAAAVLLGLSCQMTFAQDLTAVCSSIKEGGLFEEDPELSAACRALFLRLLAQSAADAQKKDAADAASADEKATDDKRDNATKDLELLLKLKEQLKTPAKELPDLAAFQSTSQRYMAELAYAAGVDIAGKLSTAFASKPKILVVSDPAMSARWTRSIDPKIVENDLDDVVNSLTELKAIKCDPIPKPSNPGGTSTTFSHPITDTVPLVAAVGVAADAIVSLASNFQPSVIKAAAVAPPNNIGLATASGIQSKASVPLWTVPPVVSETNKIVVKVREITKLTSTVEAQIAKFASPESTDKVVNKACYDPLKSRATATAERFKVLVTSNDNVLGSPVDRAARALAFSEAGFKYLLDVQHVVSGGAVSGYQRNRFSAIKLVVGSDVAVAYRLIAADGLVEASDFVSFGKGRSIPMGEFSDVYSQAPAKLSYK